MPPKKSIFRQPGTKHFQLVHRSQRDPLIHDPGASGHVLKPFERENAKKGKSRADLESSLPASVIQHDENRNVGEAAQYGIYYDDTEYDYMQHLRTVGLQEDGVDSILIEAPTSKNNDGKGKMVDLLIPQDALPSRTELPWNYESQQAIPESIAGFQPDMDPHLRQALEALEDDAFINDQLADDFFDALVNSGERGTEDVHFDFDEDGIDEVTVGAHNEDKPIELSWEQRFARFKKSQVKLETDSTSDHEFTSEDGDTVRGLPTIMVIGGKGKKRRKGSSDASSYSMSSSSMHRNEALQTLDDRFDQIIKEEYHEGEDDEGEPPISDEDTDEAPKLITSREDFDVMINEFLYDYEILGRKMKPKLEGETPTDKLETIRRALGQDRYILVNNDDDQALDLMTLENVPKEDRWDCETILTTNSNLENHPRIIHIKNSKPIPKISLDPRTGLPIAHGFLNTPSRSTIKAEDESDTHDHDTETIAFRHTTISRPRNESKESKRARKAAVNTEKQNRRAQKRSTKEQFTAQLAAQKRTLANKSQHVKKL